MYIFYLMFFLTTCALPFLCYLLICLPHSFFFFFLKDAAPPEISPFPPHAALPIGAVRFPRALRPGGRPRPRVLRHGSRRLGQALARRGDLAAPPAPPLILASTSPRRREILEQLRIPFEAVVPSYDETEGDPVAHALGKARSVGPFDERPALGCDTEVLCNGRVYGKPEHEVDAEAMLESLAGKTHEAVSGLALITPAR